MDVLPDICWGTGRFASIVLQKLKWTAKKRRKRRLRGPFFYLSAYLADSAVHLKGLLLDFGIAA